MAQARVKNTLFEGQRYFEFFECFHEAFKDCSNEEYGKCIRAIAEYSLYGIEPNFEKPGDQLFWRVEKPFLLKGG